MTAVLGHVLRDERLFRSWLADAGPTDSVARQGLLVVLGSLGASAALLGTAVPRSDAAAQVLGLILDDPSSARERLATFGVAAEPDAALEQAVSRIELGYALTALGGRPSRPAPVTAALAGGRTASGTALVQVGASRGARRCCGTALLAGRCRTGIRACSRVDASSRPVEGRYGRT